MVAGGEYLAVRLLFRCVLCAPSLYRCKVSTIRTKISVSKIKSVQHAHTKTARRLFFVWQVFTDTSEYPHIIVMMSLFSACSSSWFERKQDAAHFRIGVCSLPSPVKHSKFFGSTKAQYISRCKHKQHPDMCYAWENGTRRVSGTHIYILPFRISSENDKAWSMIWRVCCAHIHNIFADDMISVPPPALIYQ